MNIARLFAPTIRAASGVDVIGYRVSRSFSTRKLLLSTLPVGKNDTRSRSMSSTAVRKDKGGKQKKAPAIPRPSSSVILISPQNHILLLHRVQTSSSFPSAHVFPGGNVSKFHDGEMPPPEDALRHTDNDIYRLAAVRETFEESGILLARTADGKLLELNEEEREKARKLVHGNEVSFVKWLDGMGAKADLDNLIPFTRWVTPANLPKRFTTQMYLYLLPFTNTPSNLPPSNATDDAETTEDSETMIATPTHDGGVEHTAAKFLPAATWLRLCRASRIVLFPPQFFLLYLLSPFLSPEGDVGKHAPVPDESTLQTQRDQVLKFVEEGKWGDMCISPTVLGGKRADGRVVLGLDRPGAEAEGRTGDKERVVLVEFKKEGPRRVEVGWRKDVLTEGRQGKL